MELDELVGPWISLAEAANLIGESPGRLGQLVREGRVPAVRRGNPSTWLIPAAFVRDGALLKGLTGLGTVLADSNFTAEQALTWIFTPDDSLPGRPIDALATGAHREVCRRAQAAAL